MHMQIDRERITKSRKQFMKETLKISATLQVSLNLDSVIQRSKA